MAMERAMAGLCPKCGGVLSSVNVERVSVNQGFKPTLLGASYTCPHCNVVLSVSLDPMTIKKDIIEEITDVLRR